MSLFWSDYNSAFRDHLTKNYVNILDAVMRGEIRVPENSGLKL
jgi:hypothetical protein